MSIPLVLSVPSVMFSPNAPPDPQPSRRRDFLRHAGGGIGMMALQSLLSQERALSGDHRSSASPPQLAPHFAPRAKRIIWLFMHGGPSHVDLFDHKPELSRYAGQPIPDSFGEVMTRRKVAQNPLLAPIKPFRPRGESGLMISDFLPHTRSWRTICA